MNAASLVVSLWLAAQSSPAEGVDPFAQPQPARKAEATIRLGEPRATAPARNPLREPTPTTTPAQEAAPLTPGKSAASKAPTRLAPSRPAVEEEEDFQSEGAIVPVQRTVAADAGKTKPTDAAAEEAGPPRVTAKDFIAGLLVAPEGEGLTGQPLRLVDALTRSAGRPPADIVRAYWELASATAVYHQRRREAAQLETLASGEREPAAEMKLAQGTARAALVESKVTALGAQQKLRSLVPMAGGALPTIADVPHTGAYHTYFHEIFGRRPAPPELTLLEQTLPLEKEAVQARFKAAQAAADHGELAWTLYQERKNELPAALAALAESGQQERAFVLSVIRYNLDIAGYALRVAPAGVAPRTIVGMLIKDPLQRTAAAEFDGQVIPAGATELIEVTEPAHLVPPDSNDAGSAVAQPIGPTDPYGRPVVRSTFEPRPGRQPANEAQPPADPARQGAGSPFNARKPELTPGTNSAQPKQAPIALRDLYFGAELPFAARPVAWQQVAQSPQQTTHYWQTAAALARWRVWDVARARTGGAPSAPQELEGRAAHLRTLAELADAKVQLRAAQVSWGLSLGGLQGVRQPADLPLPVGVPDLSWLDASESATGSQSASQTKALWRTALKQRAAAALGAEEAVLREFAMRQNKPYDGSLPISAVALATRQEAEASQAFCQTLVLAQQAVGAGATPPTPTPVRSTPALPKSPAGR